MGETPSLYETLREGASLSLWEKTARAPLKKATVYTQVLSERVSGIIDPLNCHYERSDNGAK